MNWLVIGIDPGPTPGIVALRGSTHPSHTTRPLVLQCGHDSAPFLVRTLLEPIQEDCGSRAIIAVEKFVVGPRAARVRTAAASAATRDLIGVIKGIVTAPAQLVERPAAAVKPWATDARLAAAGLLEPTSTLRHARDAARHALFAAVHAGLLSDPLSERAA